MKIQMIIVKILILGAFFIISNQNIHLLVSSERGIFFDAYADWIANMAGKIASMTGNAVKLEWLPR